MALGKCRHVLDINWDQRIAKTSIFLELRRRGDDQCLKRNLAKRLESISLKPTDSMLL